MPEVLNEIGLERERQDKKWGEQDHPDSVWLAILTEEVGESAKAILEKSNLEEELVQVAAVATAWVEAIRRSKEKRYESLHRQPV